MTGKIVILGVFVADTAFRADRAPRMGETIIGNSFALGPGGKGSNQAVAAAKLGADVTFLSKLGRDPFADMALKTWADAGVTPRVTRATTLPPGPPTSSSRSRRATTPSSSVPAWPPRSRSPTSRPMPI